MILPRIAYDRNSLSFLPHSRGVKNYHDVRDPQLR